MIRAHALLPTNSLRLYLRRACCKHVVGVHLRVAFRETCAVVNHEFVNSVTRLCALRDGGDVIARLCHEREGHEARALHAGTRTEVTMQIDGFSRRVNQQRMNNERLLKRDYARTGIQQTG